VLRTLAKHRAQEILSLRWPAKFNYRILLHRWRDSLCGLLKTISTIAFQQVTPPSSTHRRTPDSVIALVGVDVDAFEKTPGRARRDAAMKDMQRLCCVKAKENITPLLEKTITSYLGEAPRGRWLTYEEDHQSQSPVIYFHYPGGTATGLTYIRRDVKLELGSLTDQQPIGRRVIRPWVADAFPAVFDDWQCEVVALDISRTFWEKATILHSEFHRPEELPTPDRYARHYFDVSRLLAHRDAPVFAADKALAVQVANWKSRLFPRAWARYDTAKHGSLRLAPPEARRLELGRDYGSMRPLFFNEPPKFEEVLGQLAAAEEKINA
jgi:hypothetical protein